MNETGIMNALVTVKNIIHITDSTFVLSLANNDMRFFPGQYVNLSFPGELDEREYSIYNSPNDDDIQILVKEIDVGTISKQLKDCKSGDQLVLKGPYGSFYLSPVDIATKKFIFIATGTGISPFHSMIKSYPNLNYTLIHGVSFGNEAYGSESYAPENYVLCTSKDAGGHFQGRVTHYLRNFDIEDDMLFYLCGNSKMIEEVMELLKEKGIENRRIFSEVFF